MISAVNGVQDMEELEGRKHVSRVYKVVLTGGLFDFYVKNSCYTVLEPYGKTFRTALILCYCEHTGKMFVFIALIRDRRRMLIYTL